MTETRRKKSWKKKLLLFFGLVFGFIMSEILLRVIGYSFPLFYTTDYHRGFALKPGAEGLYQREGQNYVRITSAGLRDREHNQTKPADVIRIALIGDSYAEALQLPMEQTFWWFLPQRLEDCKAFPGKRVETINFGVSGYGTAQELITLQQQAWDYSPDIVLLAVTTNNDISDNMRPLKNLEEIPYFTYRNGQLVLDASFRNSATYRQRNSTLSRVGGWIHNHLRTVQLIHQVQFVVKMRLTDWRNRRKLAQTEAAGAASQTSIVRTAEHIGIENMIYFEPEAEEWKEGWRVTEGLIKQMDDEVKQKGAKLLLVTLSNAVQVYPDAGGRQRFLQQIGSPTIFYPNLRLKALADREQIDFLDLAQPMQSYADQNKVFLHGFGSDLGNGHWNADGHRLAADLIAKQICK